MRRMELAILRDSAYPRDTRYEVVGDLGTGSIDTDHPLPPGRVPFWPEEVRPVGHLRAGHLADRHLQAADADGHLHGVHLASPHLRPSFPLRWSSPGYVFGRVQHVVRVIDGAGNVTTPVAIATTVNGSPPRPTDARRDGYDPVTDRVVVRFGPSRFVPLAGN